MTFRRTLCLFLGVILLGVPLAYGKVEPPVKFEGSKLSNVDDHHFNDLGNFHGEAPQVPGKGWNYWGAREPIVTDDWVVFPVPGDYEFIVKSKSDQFDANDAKKDIWAEFDVRLYPEKALKKKLARSIGDLNLLKGNPDADLLLLHEKARADAKAGDDWATSSTLVTIEQRGLTGQIAIWFTNDKWQPDPPPAKDRNLRILSLEIMPPGGLSVDPRGKLAVTWAAMKQVER